MGIYDSEEDDSETFEEQVQDWTDEKLQERFEYYSTHDWERMARTVTEEMKDRNLDIENPDYAELSRGEVLSHQRFRKEWLDE